VQILVDADANTEATDELGETALHHAASDGYMAIVNLLIRAGANVNARNKIGQTPLMNTIPYQRVLKVNSNNMSSNYADTAKILLQAGADANVEYYLAEKIAMNWSSGSSGEEIGGLLYAWLRQGVVSAYVWLKKTSVSSSGGLEKEAMMMIVGLGFGLVLFVAVIVIVGMMMLMH
jgi:hypothetical protein